ncbi:MAG: type II toxin-antitoxin system PemK/MazF family toxin [Dehalococcoidia bacterium]
MATVRRGDIVAVDFYYTDRDQTKRRPALVLSSANYLSGREEVLLAGLTGNVHRHLPGDTRLQDWEEADLPRPSVVMGIIQTAKQSVLLRVVGRLTPRDLSAVDANLRAALVL